jgi:hypothetical protein
MTLRKIISQFILSKILLALHQIRLKLEFRKYKKAIKLSNFTCIYLNYRLRNILNFQDIGLSKKEDDFTFFIISNLLELKLNTEDRAKSNEVKGEISSLQSKASFDDDVIMLIDIFAQLKNVSNVKLEKEKVLSDRVIPNNQHFVDIENLKKTEKELKIFAKKNIDIVKERTAFKINFSYSEVSSIIPVIAPLVIIGSYLFNKTYYSVFDIEVSNYFSTSDYLATSIEHIERSFITGIFSIIGIFLSLYTSSRNITYADSKKVKGKIIEYLFLLLFIFLIGYSYYSHNILFYFYLNLGFFILILKISYLIAYRLFNNSIKALFFLIFSLQIISNSLIQGREKAERLKNNWKKNSYELKFNQAIENSITTPVIIIGQNSKYIFLSDSTFSTITITERSKVELYKKTIANNN